jgi:hypothetical protein
MSQLPDPTRPLDEGAAAEVFAAIFDGKVADEALGRASGVEDIPLRQTNTGEEDFPLIALA